MILEKSPEEVTTTERTYFKTITFGLIYGMGAKKLATQLKISKEEAQVYLDKYLGRMTRVGEFIEATKDFFKLNGYTETLFGRRRYITKNHSGVTLDEWGAERECVNHVIQGSNADIIKIAMIRLAESLEERQLKSCMMIQVHDEIVLDIHPDEVSIMKDLVVDIMQSAVNLKVPMITDPTFASNWADAH